MANSNQLLLKGNTSTAAKFGNAIIPFSKANPDIFMAVGILMILGLLVIPLPAFMLDMFLSINIAISVLIILVSVYLVNPLDISSFPTLLLLATLFRLGLNVATTRLILSQGSAGQIIHAFGTFVIGGNYIVGIIIFLILLVINFVVIIKGSTRIAEVAARFTLDALPGKQMSIDADLNAGFIDEQEAKGRREKLSKESDFYGAMDGSAKFIRGDAIAGLIIVAINIIGGFAIGMTQQGMDLTTALSTYTILTIGDGIVTQVPSLLISVAAGLVVTRSASADKLEIELSKQFGTKPKPLAIVSGAMLIFGVMPGMPFIPFLLLSVLAGAVALYRSREEKAAGDNKLRDEMIEAEQVQKPEEAPVEDLLRVDPVEIELGYSLIALVDEAQGGDVFKRISNVRRQLATELGIILPPVRVRDNLQLEPEEYVIRVRNNEAARNILHPTMLLAMNPGNTDGEVSGIKVTEPVFGLPATWITHAERENAEVLGYTVVESATVLTTHLTELLRRNADKLITRQDVRHLIENLKTDYPALIEELTPDSLPFSSVQKVLQNLLKEGIPVRDLPIILESLLEYYPITKNIEVLTEFVRHNMSETIKKLYQDDKGVIHAISLDAQIEDRMTTALQTSSQSSNTPTLGLSPDVIKEVHQSLSDAIDEVTIRGFLPVVICSAQVRPYFHRMIRTQFPMVSVISYTELPAETDIEIIGSISL